MMKILKTIGLMAFVAVAVIAGVQAQNGFNMPYSQFGIGLSEQPYNLPMAARMGGVTYTRSGNNFVNPFNPASYASIEKESFVFDMGVNLQTSTLRDNNSSVYDADGNLGYLLVAMPVTSWLKVAGGLMPYSTVSYESVSTVHHDDLLGGDVKTVYDGNGGVNQVFLGLGFNILDPAKHKGTSLQAGVNGNLLVGRIQRAISYSFQGNDSTFFLNGRRYKETRLANLIPDFGLQFRQPMGEKFTLGVAAVYKPLTDMLVKEEALIYTYHASDQTLVDTVFPQRGEDPAFRSSLKRANTVGVGLSLERNKMWQMAVDLTFAEWQGMKYTEGTTTSIFGTSATAYGPYSRYAAGFEKIGNMDAPTYWGRISWSLGAHLEQGSMYLDLGGSQRRLDEWGLGAGASLPMRKGRSLLSISVAYSRLGSTYILQLDAVTFGIAVSSCERWFVKRKYN